MVGTTCDGPGLGGAEGLDNGLDWRNLTVLRQDSRRHTPLGPGGRSGVMGGGGGGLGGGVPAAIVTIFLFPEVGMCW